MAPQVQALDQVPIARRLTVREPRVEGGIRYVARQPILDLRGRGHGYELLFRNGPDEMFCGDGQAATRTMIDNTVLFGLSKLTGGLLAFVNCTEEALTSDMVHLLPPSMTVLEILETIEPSPNLFRACCQLKAAGYRLALDDFVWRRELDSLVHLADYVKVDFLLTDRTERRSLLHRLRGVTVALVAEKVETEAQFLEAREDGFTLIQGYYFCRPVLMENHTVPVNRLSHVEILRLLQSEPIDIHALAQQVKRDASLTYRLLRLINSPMCAMRQEVRSVHSALIAVGEETFRRLATLAIASELNAGQPEEVLRTAFVRARFCELAAALCGLDNKEQYLLGLLSLLPTMLRVPMKQLTPSLPMRDEVLRALMGESLPDRCLLRWLEGHERGDWAACDTIADRQQMNIDDLLRCYREALAWAESALHFA